MKAFLPRIIMVCSILTFVSCNSKPDKDNRVRVLCIRDSNVIYYKIKNCSDSIIYVPSVYNAVCRIDSDTLHFETKNKPSYSVNTFFKYKNILPFTVYSTKQIPDEPYDEIIRLEEPANCYNAFVVRPFILIYPDSTITDSIHFYVPREPSTAQFVFYKLTLKDWLNQINKRYYLEEDFMLFDSLNANYSTCEIINTYH